MKTKALIFALTLSLILALTLPARADETLHGPQGYPPQFPPQAKNTLLNAVTATGVGTAKNLGAPAEKQTCTVTWGGTTPTNVVVNIWGSEDGTQWPSTSGTNYLAQQTVTSSPWIFHIFNKVVTALKGEYVSKSGGNTDTSVTITCTSKSY